MLHLSRAEALAGTLILFAVACSALAAWARWRAPRATAVGAWRLALSQAVSGYSFWLVLGMSAAAYLRGWSALWLAVGLIVGALLNGLYVGPRLVALCARSGARTALECVQPAPGARASGGAAAIIFVFLFIGIIAQLRVVGSILGTGLGAEPGLGVAIVAALGLLPALFGGRRAAFDISILCALLVAAVAALLAFPAFQFASGTGGLLRGLRSIDPAVSGLFGTGFVAAIGGCALGLTLVGQPAVLDQFQAVHSERTARFSTVWSSAWLALVTGAMLLFGWSALVLYSSVDDPNLVLLDATARLLPPSLQSLPIIALALATVAAIGHQIITLGLIGAAAWPHEHGAQATAQRAQRIAWIAAGLATVTAALTSFGSMRVYVLTLVCLGVALGPVMLVRLASGELRPAAIAIAIRVGLISALVLLLVRSDFANSLAVPVSFLLALAVAYGGRGRRPTEIVHRDT